MKKVAKRVDLDGIVERCSRGSSVEIEHFDLREEQWITREGVTVGKKAQRGSIGVQRSEPWNAKLIRIKKEQELLRCGLRSKRRHLDTTMKWIIFTSCQILFYRAILSSTSPSLSPISSGELRVA